MNRTKEVLVVRTGIANIDSVFSGLGRVEASPRLTQDAREVRGADYVMLPGVGAFGAGMCALREDGLDQAIMERAAAGRPTLAICLGMQLFLQESEESPGVSGLGIVPGTARRFSTNVRCPQLGWNKVEAGEGCKVLNSGFAYFANSYRLSDSPAGWESACADYDGTFVAAIERGPVVLAQFHPELSGVWGLSLLRRWLEE